MKLEGRGGMFVNLPYWPGLLLAKFATGVNRTLLGGRIDLPGLLVPASYRARFHPLHLSNRKAKELLGWQPRYNFREAWERSAAHTPNQRLQTSKRAATQEARHGS